MSEPRSFLTDHFSAFSESAAKYAPSIWINCSRAVYGALPTAGNDRNVTA
jgi:hypothetical protein